MKNNTPTPTRKRLHLLTAATALCCIAALAAAAPPKVHTHLPSTSIAVSDDALATAFNPAGLGVGRGLNLYYLRTYQSDWAGDDAFFAAVPGAGFGLEFGTAPNNIDFTRYTLASGYALGGGLHWGLGYSWINADNTDYDAFRSLAMGFMYRRRFLSIGATARDLNRPTLLNEKLGRTYDIGIALRPGTWRTTLSLDMRKTQAVDGIELRYGLEIRPIRELMLRGTLTNDLRFDLRFSINLGNWGIGSNTAFDENRNAHTGVGYFHFANAPKTKPLRRRQTFLDLPMSALQQVLPVAKWDTDVTGVLVRINGSRYGIAQLQEMADAVLDFRESGKLVLCYLSNCSTGDYTVAAQCDGILIHPSGEIRLIGIRTERTFYKRALDMLGIRADIENHGEYKSAAEPYTRSDMSEPHREIQNIILDDLYQQIVSAIAEGRGWTPENVTQRIDAGPYTARQAFTAELADRLVYEDELAEVVTDLTDTRTHLIPLSEYLDDQLYPHTWHSPQPKIAIIRAEGLMLMGDSFVDPFLGTQVMGAETITRIIKQVREDTSIKAVVLRIDSGGGLVTAADAIWRELIHLKAVKPLVVSMGDVAASGGYYIAAPADTIIAQPGTITGSIGVISGKYSFKGLYEKLGIRKEILKRGKHADFYSDYGDYPESERRIVQKQVKEIYDDFVAKVALGRTNLTQADVDELGRGRIWSGRQAAENGLVDTLGGLDLALAIARERAGLQKKPIEIVEFPKQTWVSQLLSGLRFPFSTTLTTELQFITGYPTFNKTARLLEAIKQHRLFLLMPYQIDL